MDRIKESFDSLPIAVCFFDKNGVVRLINHRMLAIASQLRKGGIQTLAELPDALRSTAANRPLSGSAALYFPVFRRHGACALRRKASKQRPGAFLYAGHRRGCHGAYVAAEASAGGKRKAGGGE